MKDTVEQQAKFAASKRRELIESLGPDVELVVIAGNSFLQASGDRAYPFQQDSNFFYLSGLLEPGCILVIDGGEEHLIIPDRNEVRVAFEGAVDQAKLSQTSGIKSVFGAKKGWQKLSQRLKKAKKVGVLMAPPRYIDSIDMFTNPSRQQLIDKLEKHNKNLKLVDLRPDLVRMRMIKNSYEIQVIKQAIKETEKLLRIIERKRQKVSSENELFAEAVGYAAKNQLEFAYDPIIAGGKNAVTLHYIANNCEIDPKSLLLLDIGLKYKGYSADITRTVGDKPSKRQREVYSAVLEVQQYAISLLKPGILLENYEEKVMQFMGKKLKELGLIKTVSKESVRQYYPHSASHFLGIDVHDVGEYESPLQKGMVLTVEPGIYIAEELIGIRIEDDVLITEDGCEVLTNKLPHNPSSLTIQT